MRDLGVTGNGCIGSTCKRLDGIVRQLACLSIVTRDGLRGGDVVGDGSDLFVDGICARRHHVSDVGDGVAVEVALARGNGPVLLSRRTIGVGTGTVFCEGSKVLFDSIWDRTRGHGRKCGNVQQNQDDSGNQHVFG